MADAALVGFAYGEFLEGAEGRSLGFRLLAPETPQSWRAEVENLARRLQSAPFPESWPQTELFCSILLADGQRLVAVARYGIEDRTPGRRHGGLELFGLVGPNTFGVTAALAIYQWLKGRRSTTEDLRSFAGTYDLVQVLAEAPTPPTCGESLPVLPIRLGQEGALLFAATAPSDPDARLGMLEQGAATRWQWLPLTGSDFPFAMYAQRGPLIAWTPHLASVAIKLEPPMPLGVVPSTSKGFRFIGWLVVLLILAGLAGNLWYLRHLDQRIGNQPTPHSSGETTRPLVQDRPKVENPPNVPSKNGDTEQFAKALYQYLRVRGAIPDTRKEFFLRAYEKLAATDEILNVTSSEGRLALGALAELTRRRTPAQVQALILEAGGEKRGIDEHILQIIADRVGQRLTDPE